LKTIWAMESAGYGPLSQCCCPFIPSTDSAANSAGVESDAFTLRNVLDTAIARRARIKVSHGQHNETGTMACVPGTLHNTNSGPECPSTPLTYHHPLDAHYDDSVVDEPQLSSYLV
jgi:hypothetical protein